MKSVVLFLSVLLATFMQVIQAQVTVPTVYVDGWGVMRWSDSRQEAAFYCVNYTLPFAHAYRAILYAGKDHKEAIDKDVYHFARLGFNAYRIHVWDVEVSDSTGNLIDNEHLDLLDYLIAKLRERNIRVLLTTMTNFGNGYPERNYHTQGFSYLYDKCQIHNDVNAIKAQTNYIGSFVKHVNPYTKQAYKDDPYIVGFEINNEPCHAASEQQTKRYIMQMLDAIKKAGSTKPVFYNVSHNLQQVNAYYDTPIQGTTYQWYPAGLVAGHSRQGNFLPYVDNYPIPFTYVKGFDSKTKIVYEFDPADINYSYMYPAMARTFRTAGFQWITQFAYDPLDIAYANTEYQTHFLNLAYTPNKAISMKIAVEVTYTLPRHAAFGQYPADTVFGDFRVSYRQDLSELNTPTKFFYSNHTSSPPVNPDSLQAIAGCGSSMMVQYEGLGAYFLDKLEPGVWRLEVMPDAVQINDPFEKASLKKDVVAILWNTWDMKITLPDLGYDFQITMLNGGQQRETLQGESVQTRADHATFQVRPGVYLLERKEGAPEQVWTKNTRWGNIGIGEFVAPESRGREVRVVHRVSKVAEKGKKLSVEAQVVGAVVPDSVLVYTDKVSFWNERNDYLKMRRVHGYTYQADVTADMMQGKTLKYMIVVFHHDKKYTFPAGVEGYPLDWDFYQFHYWNVPLVAADESVQLLRRSRGKPGDEHSTILYHFVDEHNGADFFVLNDSLAVIRKYVKDELTPRQHSLNNMTYLCLDMSQIKENITMEVGLITADGFTYMTQFTTNNETPTVKIPLANLKQNHTLLLPSPYPTFLPKQFSLNTQIPFQISDVETLELRIRRASLEHVAEHLGNVRIE
jgi:hypothetical protein